MQQSSINAYAPLPVTHQGQVRGVRSYDLTRYEMVAEHDDDRYLIAYNVRATRQRLHAELFSDAVRLRILDGAEGAFIETTGKGRQTAFHVNGWTVRWSGRTEREAIQSGELRLINAS